MAVDFSVKQLEFTRYIRNPNANPAPADLKPERMAIYRELMFNNIESFLASNFPVIRKIMADKQWLELVQDFFSTHHNKTPYFSEIAEEFLDFLENERDNPTDFPFLLELAHYEWVELALAIAKEEISVTQQQTDDLLDRAIRLSPLAWPLAYQYPVQLISPEFSPLEPPEQPTTLLAYRDEADAVKFVDINPVTYRLLEIIQEHDGIVTSACLYQVAEESRHPNPDTVISGGLQILKEFVEKTIILVIG